MLRAAALSLISLFVIACAGVNQYSTGVPARDADRFMVSMEMAAQQRGHNAYRSGDGYSLNVEVGGLGSLTYAIQQDKVTVTTYPSRDGSDGAIQERAHQLKVEHDTLMQLAREEAWNNKAFTD